MPELALKGDRKSKQKPSPVWPQYEDAERNALTEVLESRIGWRTPGSRGLFKLPSHCKAPVWVLGSVAARM
jgi:hypothetical protein